MIKESKKENLESEQKIKHYKPYVVVKEGRALYTLSTVFKARYLVLNRY